ncbi:hypothetical protein CDL15_Pgr008303 [Punica granatum]|uniref:Uncharacterized protein n=1 Tax=Punica granatum TaxID=22663 RepID=A0A218W3H3_PUNGR|nr:hypothetical protein CDL15_Pgr008303 [Punica granatum]
MLERLPRRCDEGFCFARCRVLKDSSSRVERLRIPSGQESESAVVLAMLVILVILALLVDHKRNTNK